MGKFYQAKKNENIFFAGQFTGVEGYVESASSGLLAGINMANLILGKNMIDFPRETAIGALSHYISDESIKNFQPMNVTFGIITPCDIKIRKKKEKNAYLADRALNIIKNIVIS